MAEFTKERIEQFIKSPLEHGLTRSEQMEMARQLLASMEQEPVAQVYQPANIGICAPLGPSVMMLKPLSAGTKLYAAPQLPQPAVPDEMEDNGNPHDEENQAYVGGWNACRAAMLQGAESPAYEIKRFGEFGANGLTRDDGELAISIQFFQFERGTTPQPVPDGGIVEKYALQAIINALQQQCDRLSAAPMPVIWPAAPQQEVDNG